MTRTIQYKPRNIPSAPMQTLRVTTANEHDMQIMLRRLAMTNTLINDNTFYKKLQGGKHGSTRFRQLNSNLGIDKSI